MSRTAPFLDRPNPTSDPTDPSEASGVAAGDPVVPPDVSVTIVAYECRDLMMRCLETLDAAAGNLRLEVIVADNDSHDGVLDAVHDAHPGALTIAVGSNEGFGRAHNMAAAAASGRYLLILNPDTVVRPGAIQSMVEFADACADAGSPVGVVAPQLLNPDGSDQGTARAFPTASAGLFGRRSPLTRWFPDNRWSRRFLVSNHRVGGDPWTVDWVSGAAMLVPRDFFGELGGFDPEFFMHFEDAELCHRVATHGRSVWCLPEAEILHDEGGTRRGWPTSQLWHFHHGAYLFARKARYPKPLDPRALGVASLLGVRFLAAVGLNTAKRFRHSR